jgi:hypothetical protein
MLHGDDKLIDGPACKMKLVLYLPSLGCRVVAQLHVGK